MISIVEKGKHIYNVYTKWVYIFARYITFIGVIDQYLLCYDHVDRVTLEITKYTYFCCMTEGVYWTHGLVLGVNLL